MLGIYFGALGLAIVAIAGLVAGRFFDNQPQHQEK
jgi:hypothetical protein